MPDTLQEKVAKVLDNLIVPTEHGHYIGDMCEALDAIIALFAEERAALEENLRSHAYKRGSALERAKQAEAREAKLVEALEEARDFIDNYQDTIDGEYGRPHPNKAMVIVQHIDAAIRDDDGWVSVKDRKPESNVGVLITDGNIVTAATRQDSCGYEYWSGYGFGGYEWEWYFENNDITHWRPLPEPPKEE